MSTSGNTLLEKFRLNHKMRHWKLKRSNSAPAEAPLSHRKHCSWNASSVISLYISWLCDITLCHHVTHLYNLSLPASLAPKNWFSQGALLMLAEPGQVCASWPIRTHWVFRRGGLLKETGGKMKCVSGRLFLSTKACKSVQIVTLNKTMDLKMSTIWVF